MLEAGGGAGGDLHDGFEDGVGAAVGSWGKSVNEGVDAGEWLRHEQQTASFITIIIVVYHSHHHHCLLARHCNPPAHTVAQNWRWESDIYSDAAAGGEATQKIEGRVMLGDVEGETQRVRYEVFTS